MIRSDGKGRVLFIGYVAVILGAPMLIGATVVFFIFDLSHVEAIVIGSVVGYATARLAEVLIGVPLHVGSWIGKENRKDKNTSDELD